MSNININPSTINLRSKGLMNSTGKLYKGCVKDATTKLSIGSIPSTYESVIYRTENKKAFGSSQKRFYNKISMDINQINSNSIQNININECQQKQIKGCENKLGQNSFISKQKRELFRCLKTPGPTYYYKNNSQSSNNIQRKCFTKQSQRNQINIINQVNKKQTTVTPGPGQYIDDTSKYWNISYNGCRSSFQTKVCRTGYQSSMTPGPGFYSINKQKIKKNKKQFIYRAGKQNLQTNSFLQKLTNTNKKEQPGPGFYNQQIPNFKPLYEKVKMSVNFISPLYQTQKKSSDGPSPTAYPIKRIYDDLTPKLIYSTFFMSETKRDPFISNKVNNSSQINVQPIKHKNFHFNNKNQWVC